MSWVPPGDWKRGRLTSIAYKVHEPDASLDDVLALLTDVDLIGELEKRGGTVLANVVAVRERGVIDGKPFAEPWLITACAVAEPRKPHRYVMVPVGETP